MVRAIKKVDRVKIASGEYVLGANLSELILTQAEAEQIKNNSETTLNVANRISNLETDFLNILLPDKTLLYTLMRKDDNFNFYLGKDYNVKDSSLVIYTNGSLRITKKTLKATIDNGIGTPSVSISEDASSLSLDFKNLKGDPGTNGKYYKIVVGTYTYTYEQWMNFSYSGYTASWTCKDTSHLVVGDWILFTGTISTINQTTLNQPIYILAEVKSIDSSTRLTMTTYGYLAPELRGPVGPQGPKGDTGSVAGVKAGTVAAKNNVITSISLDPTTKELVYNKEIEAALKSDLTNYYTKQETFTKEEIDERISAIPKFGIQVVEALPVDNISETTIYLLRESTVQTLDDGSAVAVDPLIGTWRFKNSLTLLSEYQQPPYNEVHFTCNNVEYTTLDITTSTLYYDDTMVYGNDKWVDFKYQTIKITKVLAPQSSSDYKLIKNFIEYNAENITDQEQANLYSEWIYVGGIWEKLGEQKVDLTGYATEEWVNNKHYITNTKNAFDYGNLKNIPSNLATKDWVQGSARAYQASDINPVSNRTGIPFATYSLWPTARANRLSFLPASQILIEESIDGGKTWTDANISDGSKIGLFSQTRPTISLPLKDGKKSCDCMLRITITAINFKNVPEDGTCAEKFAAWTKGTTTAEGAFVSDNYYSGERYCTLGGMFLWLNSNADKLYCTVEKSTGIKPNTWIKEGENFCTGWSGSNFIKLTTGNFGGGKTQYNNYWYRRITFRTATSKNTFDDSQLSSKYLTSRQSVSEITMYGPDVWSTSNDLMNTDRIYHWDSNKTVFFPAIVNASEFIEKGVSLTNKYALKGDINKHVHTFSGNTKHTPTGTISKPVIEVTTSPVEITEVLDKGTLPTLTSTYEEGTQTVGLVFTSGSLISTTNTNVVSDVSAVSSVPTFTGKETTITISGATSEGGSK